MSDDVKGGNSMNYNWNIKSSFCWMEFSQAQKCSSDELIKPGETDN